MLFRVKVHAISFRIELIHPDRMTGFIDKNK